MVFYLISIIYISAYAMKGLTVYYDASMLCYPKLGLNA